MKYKFRAWVKDKKIMDKVKEIHFGTRVVLEGELEYVEPIDNVVLMMHTGLKDKNGKEIYEGNLLFTDNGWRDSEIYVVKIGEYDNGGVWEDAEFGTGVYMEDKYKDVYTLTQLIVDDQQLKIVGNIYENSNLVGDKDD